ncbi:nucleotidyltransferase family protein [Candidatus Thioglobus sp.]|nr:nucleotidyltransferase family protein [Candidatus Thioglobus sp.]
MNNLSDFCIGLNSTIEEAMNSIDHGNIKIVFVVDGDNKFLGTLNDGDIRRAILRGKVLTDIINDIYNSNAIFADKHTSKEALLNLCSKNHVSQIPILNKDSRVVDIFILDELLVRKQYNNSVVLMVGGLGKRMRPLTKNTPKPMLKIGKTPILHTIIKGFSKYGFTNFIMCLGYKSDVIQDYFQDGNELGVSIEYIIEDKPMGTAGALTLLKEKISEPFFVMNGDLLTNVNYEQVFDFHKSNNSKATMCVSEYEIEVPYGVVSVNHENIVSIEEKPLHSFFVNAGIYLLEPECIDLIPNNEFYDMPMLFEKLLFLKEKIVSFPMKEYWLDIGRMTEYEKANHEYNKVFNI